MPSKLNARVSFKHGTQADWEKAENFIPYDRELIVYDCDETHDYERVKLGDGVYNPQTGKVEGTNINDLPFLTFGFKTSKEGNYQFGTKADNLTSTSEHSIVSGSNISAGIRGLKIKNTIMLEGNQLQVYPVDEEASKIYEFYNVASLVGARIAFVLNHHSFEQYEVIGWDNNGKCFYCSRFDGKDSIPEYFELAYEEDEVTPWEHGNYMWFYTREDNGSITTFDVSLNDNAPIRPEADFTYALGDNIQVVGRSSFSSGQGNQNIGWYSATMGRFNTAYYSAFALGAFNNATGTYAVALNQNTEASAVAATSKGYQTKATANYSEAGGQGTEANHKAAFTHGFKTKSGRQHQAVFGELNEETKTALLVVGNGKGEKKETETIHFDREVMDPQNGAFPLMLNFPADEWEATYEIEVLATGEILTGNCNDDIVSIDIRNDNYVYSCIYDNTIYSAPSVSLTYSHITQAAENKNAFTVEADGSAIVQTQGKSNNAVVIKQTLDTELNKKASEIAKDINDAIVDASNAARDLDSASHRYTDSLGDYFIIEDEWLDTCVQPISQERGNYFITKFDANATSGGVIKHSTNYIKEYTDNFKYSLDVYVAEANTSVPGFGNAVGPHINIGTFDGTEVYIQFRVGSLFLWGVEKLGDKIQTGGLGTTTSPAQVTGATIEVGKNYKVEVEKNGSTLFCTVGEYHFSFVEKQPLTFVPNFLINCRYANCAINNRKLISRDNKLVEVAESAMTGGELAPKVETLTVMTDNLNNITNKLMKYVVENNNYAWLETLTSTDNKVKLSNVGFSGLIDTKNASGNCVGGARIVNFSNDYNNLYSDFIIKVTFNIQNADTTSNVGGAAGVALYLFNDKPYIQFRVNGSIVHSLDGTTHVISNMGTGAKNTDLTFYFKYLQNDKILNIYKEGLDNLVHSCNVTAVTNTTPYLGFGARCCEYSVKDCAILKGNYEIKTVTQQQFNSLLDTKKDPYIIYTIKE